MADEVEFVSDEDIPQVERVKRKTVSISLNSGDCDTPVSGSTVYGFHTPKRRGALAQAASSAIHNKTPAYKIRTTPTSQKRKNLQTNKKGDRRIASASDGDEAAESQDEHNVSGYSLRHRRKAVLLKGVERDSDSEDSDSGSVDHDEPESRVFNKVTNGNTNQADSAAQTNPVNKRRARDL